MTEPRSERRLRAWRTMEIVTGVCVVAAVSIGAHELASGGVEKFFDRPPGVGASESELEAPDQVAEAPAAVTPKPAALVPNAVLPDRLGGDRRSRHRH